MTLSYISSYHIISAVQSRCLRNAAETLNSSYENTFKKYLSAMESHTD